MGAVTPCGNTVAELWQSLEAGRSGIRTITRFNTTGFDCHIAGEVVGFELDRFVVARDQKKMDLFTQYAMGAAEEAMLDAGFGSHELSSDERDSFGAVLGSGIGGLTTIWHEANGYRGPRRTSPFFIPAIISNLAPGFISLRWGLRGPNKAVASACASATHAIGDAARLIAHGYADRMLTGGAESGVNPLGIGGFGAMNALSLRNATPHAASRPFDQDRDGFVLSEGAGILVLEERELALGRGAKIYAEVAGYGETADAFHITRAPDDGAGPMRAMALALDDAGIVAEQVGYINAHATSTPTGDRIESRAIRTLFGKHCSKLSVSSTKSVTGHLLGAAGAVETIATAMTAATGIAPPTINVFNQDSETDFDVTPHTSKKVRPEYLMNNSIGFGGTNATLVLRAVGL